MRRKRLSVAATSKRAGPNAPGRVARTRSRGAALIAVLAMTALGGAVARAEPEAAKPDAAKADAPKAEAAKPDAAKAEAPKIALELNKLEQTEKGCRVYMVTTNATAVAYPTF